jgi:hypothetical protein
MHRFTFLITIGLMTLLALTGAIGAQQFSAEEGAVVRVSNVEELYAAVNNPAYRDMTVVMASGTYTLTAVDADNRVRLNGGDLILQPGMSLVGQNRYIDFNRDGIWDPRDDNHDGVADTDPVRGLVFAEPDSETIIDGINLSASIGAVRAGLNNRVEKLTVRNTNRLLAAIDVNLMPSFGGTSAEIRDCLLEDGQRGIRLPTVRQDGFHGSAILERNISRRHLGNFGFGVQIVHIGPSENSSWDVILRNNVIYGNRVGLFAPGEGSANVQSHVFSMENVYLQNDVGINLQSGRDNFQASPEGGNGNYIHFTSLEDRIIGNSGTSVFGLGGGVVAIGGLITDARAEPSSNDELDLQFIGTLWLENFQGTQRRDLQVYGSFAQGGVPGINDRARVLIRHATSDGGPEAFQFIPSRPEDPTNTDASILTFSDIRFIHVNTGRDPAH